MNVKVTSDRSQLQHVVTACNNELKAAQSTLESFAKDLGAIVFLEARNGAALDIAGISERQELEDQMESLTLEKTNLDAEKPAGFMEKAKRLAQTTALSGRIMLAQQRIAEKNRTLGMQVLEKKQEETLLESNHKPLLLRIKTARESVSECEKKLLDAQQSLNEHASQLSVQEGNAPEPVYKMDGVGVVLVVFENKLEITPVGFLGFANRGLKGTKTLMFHSITAIQHKRSGITNGYLQFSVPGGNESKGGLLGAAKDENTFLYSGNDDFAVEIKNFIESRIGRHTEPATVGRAQSSSSVADEILKLSELRAQGILSDDEFQGAKAKLLGK